VHDFLTAIPPLPEQQAIATALNDMDVLLASLESLLLKKRDLKQATMQQLLTGRTRLEGFSEAWKVKKLGDIASFYSGGTPSTENPAYYDSDIPWITSSDLNKEVINEVEGRITKLGLENSSAKMVNANTLLIALYGATAGVTAITKIKAAINQAVLAIVPSQDNHEFLFFKLSSLKDLIINTYTQGGQPNLSGKIVKSIELYLPSPPEQQAITSVLSDMDAEISGLEEKLEKTKMLKQGMMQQLLTGKIRLL
jgi:type I restriction enzyme, S subunit